MGLRCLYCVSGHLLAHIMKVFSSNKKHILNHIKREITGLIRSIGGWILVSIEEI